MTLAPGARLGPYEVVAPLGAGGMGEVYRARDTKLNRDVAVKILPDLVAHDADRVARFTREAQALAALNHPNIAQIYGIVEAPSEAGTEGAHVHALVMELVEGEDLSAIIMRGPLSLTDAVPIARQIADALEAAHEQGIVHRDLKPANIKVRADGAVKVLDFGLAKALDPMSGSSAGDARVSPTLTARATRMGLVLGTAAYMAPEQARGKAVDKRADIWAFGVVLYEMLTGRGAFEGEESSDIIAAVLRQDIRWATLPPGTPPRLRELLERCLERDPKSRLRDIGEARVTLAALERGGADDPRATGPGPASQQPRRREAVAWTVAGLLLLAAAGVLLTRPSTREAPPRVLRATLPLPIGIAIELDGERSGMPSLSPDGRRIVFGAREGAGPMRIWVHDLASGVAKYLPGTEGGHRPFWSPDGSTIGFFTWGSLSTIPAEGGAVRRLAVARDARGGTWSPNGTILFAPFQRGPLFAVSERGGNATPATEPGKGAQGTHRFPQFLPDGEHFLYLDRPASYGPQAGSAVVIGRLGSPAQVARLVEHATNAVYADGHLLYVRDGALVAQRFDPVERRLSGEPAVVVSDLLFNRRFSYGVFSASGSGLLVFETGRQRDLSQLVWRDRAGRRLGELGTPGILSGFGGLAVSPDARWAATARVDEGTTEADVWLYDLARGSESRLVRKGDDAEPVFAADSRALYASSSDGDTSMIVRRNLDSGSEAVLFRDSSGAYLAPVASVNGGASLLYAKIILDGGSDLLTRQTSGDSVERTIVGTPADDRDAQVSPDGRWLAWASDESGRYEVYVAPFPESGGSRFQVSRDGGVQPRWNPRGGELFFKTPENMLTAVPIEASSSTFAVGTPMALFPIVEFTGWTYAVAADGARFLVREPLAERDASPLTLLTDWTSLMRPK
jgi:eukaryotic-like serine/threonine-protein kinase